jgi:hypothetical protein
MAAFYSLKKKRKRKEKVGLEKVRNLKEFLMPTPTFVEKSKAKSDTASAYH